MRDRFDLIVAEIFGRRGYGEISPLTFELADALRKVDAEARVESESMLRNETAKFSLAIEDANREIEELRRTLSRVETWTRVYGAALVPHGCADSYGDGMRTAKRTVSELLNRGAR
jgi:hypothetical protein